MTSKVQNLYKSARNNDAFVNQLKVHEADFFNKKWYSIVSDIEKCTIASIYMGWLIAKNGYRESDYI